MSQRLLTRALTVTIIAALTVAALLLCPSDTAHPPQRVSATAPPPVVYTGPTTDPIAEIAAVEQAQLATWYESASTLPSPKPPRAAKPRRAVEGNLGAQQAQADGVWDRIAQCESGGNWATNTGNGYYGGLQMNMSFWHSYGGDEYAERPDLASREQQIVVAERARDSGRGYRPWPVCGRRA